MNVWFTQILFSSKDKKHSRRGEENPATDLGPAEEGTDHLLGHTEKGVQTMQRKDERGEEGHCILYTATTPFPISMIKL